MRVTPLLFFVLLFPLAMSASVFTINDHNYMIVDTRTVTGNLQGHYYIYLDFSRGNPGYAVDDFAVTRIPYGPDVNMIQEARSFITYLITSGVTPAVVSHVWVDVNDQAKLAYLVVPLVHEYKPLSDVYVKYMASAKFYVDFNSPYHGHTGYVFKTPIHVVQTPDFNIYTDEYLYGAPAFVVLYRDPFAPPDTIFSYYERDSYVIFDFNDWRPGTLSDPSIVPVFAAVLADRAPRHLPVIRSIVVSSYKSNGGLFSWVKGTTDAFNEYCWSASVVFHQEFCMNKDFHISAVTDPRAVTISVDHNVPASVLSLLDEFAQTYNPTRSLSGYPGASDAVVTSTASAAGQFSMTVNLSRSVTIAYIAPPATRVPEKNVEVNVTVVKKVAPVLPVVRLWTDTPAVTRTGASFYLAIFNPSDHYLHVWVDPLYWGLPEGDLPYANVPRKPFDLNLPPNAHFYHQYSFAYVTASEPKATFRITSLDLNARELNTLVRTLTFHASYSVTSFCLDRNYIAYVRGSAVGGIKNCAFFGGYCSQDSLTTAHCTGTSLLDRANKVYHELYGPKGNNFLLFGATGALSELASFFEGSSAGASGAAGAAASGLSGLLMGLGTIAVAYLAYKFMPDGCKAKPWVALGAIPVGLLFGGVGLLALSAGGLAYCYLLERD